MSEILALGVSHKTAPLELRERLALPEGRAVGVLGELRDSEQIHEAAALSTCNRTELYVVAAEPVEAESHALGLLAREADIRLTELLGHIYSLRGPEAASHLFAVTAGLDSMILGEAEIQGQVKRAYELALVEGATGPILNRLFRGALAAGKRARSETGISQRGLSIPSVSVELAQRALGDLAQRTVLLVGAGETAELTARALAARGAEAVFVANRHYDRAIGLAQRFGGHAVRIEELPDRMDGADIVVSSTNSPHHLIEREELELVMERRGRPPAAARGPGRPARHRAELPRRRRRQPPRRRRRPGDRRSQRIRSRVRGTPRRADSRARAGPLRGLDRLASGRADDRRPAPPCRRGDRARAGRERAALGEPLGCRPRAPAGDGARNREQAAARTHGPDQALGRETRTHTPEFTRCASCSASTSKRLRSGPRTPR